MSERPQGGLGVSVRRLAGTLLAIAQTRLELLATEVAEEKLRVGALAVYAVAAFFFLGFGAVMAALLLTVLWWDSHRLLGLGVFTGVFLGFGLLAALLAARQARRGSRLFAASLAELARDRDALADD
jgi:uncharacterized membrane protein YqjE